MIIVKSWKHCGKRGKLKTLWKKRKLLVLSNFSFCHNECFPKSSAAEASKRVYMWEGFIASGEKKSCYISEVDHIKCGMVMKQDGYMYYFSFSSEVSMMSVLNFSWQWKTRHVQLPVAEKFRQSEKSSRMEVIVSHKMKICVTQ